MQKYFDSRRATAIRNSAILKPLALSVLVPMATFAVADIQFFGPAQTGMAGAGLALPIFANTEHADPAMFSYIQKFQFLTPTIQAYLRNLTLSDLRDNFGNISGGGVNSSNLSSFAHTFGDNTKQLGLGGDIGVGFGGFVIGASGGALVETVPSKQLQADVKSGIPLQNYNINSDALDAYGYGFYSIDAAYGAVIPYSKNPVDPRVSAGVRLRVIKPYYTHQFVTGAQIVTGSTNATLSPEMMGSNTLSNNAFGVDFGLHAAFGQDKNFYTAMQVRNLNSPGGGFNATLPFDQTKGVIGETSVNPFVTQYDIGLGATLEKKADMALDVIDVGNRAGLQDLRVGVDYRISSAFSLQGGYSSRNGWAAGIGFFGISVAVSNQFPLTIAAAFKF